MDQHEITREIPLLNADGELTEPGYAKKLLPVYRRADIKASPMRIKEWDYYLINNGRFALALTIDDNGYMGLDSISLLNFEEGWEITTSPMCFMPLGKRKLPETSKTGDTTAIGKNYSIYFKNNGSGVRTLIAQMKRFGPAGSLYAKVELFDEPEESMVIATPFDKPGHFYYNQKINCMRARGEVTYDGHTYVFDPSDSFAVLDWGARRVDIQKHMVLGLGFRRGGRRSLRLEHRLRLRQHLGRQRKHAVLQRQGAQAQSGEIQHSRR